PSFSCTWLSSRSIFAKSDAVGRTADPYGRPARRFAMLSRFAANVATWPPGGHSMETPPPNAMPDAKQMDSDSTTTLAGGGAAVTVPVGVGVRVKGGGNVGVGVCVGDDVAVAVIVGVGVACPGAMQVITTSCVSV